MADIFENLLQYLREWANKDIHKDLVVVVNAFKQKEKKKTGFQTFICTFDNKISTKFDHPLFVNFVSQSHFIT